MNLNKIVRLLDFARIDQDEIHHNADRRGFFKKAGDFGVSKLVTALPLGLVMLPKTVKAQSSSVTDVLNFALTLEYLEDEFYKMGLGAFGLIPQSDREIFSQISQHETAHVAFLRTVLGSSAVDKPAFDFTAGGQFGNAFSDYMTFLALSQAFEDTGVRAYKGQAGNLMTDDGTLKAALQIHSVEARHAAQVRVLRGEAMSQSIKAWVSGKEANGAPESVYSGEENITHAGASLDAISSLSNLSSNAKTEAFDEPLTKEEVMTIVQPFLA